MTCFRVIGISARESLTEALFTCWPSFLYQFARRGFSLTRIGRDTNSRILPLKVLASANKRQYLCMREKC
jgi:hypothetical protein